MSRTHRFTNSITPPVDSRETVEIASGIHIPANRQDEYLTAIVTNPDVAEMMREITMERTLHDGLTDDAVVEVPFWFLAEVQRIMALKLLEASTANTAQARKVHSVADAFLNYGGH
jgi:hypothetical protein